MITVMWAGLGALAGVAVLCGVWAIQAIRRDLAEERADRAASHVARHARVPQLHHDEFSHKPLGVPSRAGVDAGAYQVAREPRSGQRVTSRNVPGPESEGASRLTAPVPAPAEHPADEWAYMRDSGTHYAAGRCWCSHTHPDRGRAPDFPLLCSPVTTATCAGGQAAPKVDSPAPLLPAAVAESLDTGRRILAELARPSDEERWPDLARPWADDTGAFRRIVGVP